jgi:hypothetical protein
MGLKQKSATLNTLECPQKEWERKERRGFLGRIEYISRFIAQLTPFREKGFEWKVERPLTFRSILFSTVRNLSILRRLSRGQTQQVTKS